MRQEMRSAGKGRAVEARPAHDRPTIGLALSGGGARGWAHIGVIGSLRDLGIEPDIVCGTSIGALVGGAYVTGRMDDLADWLEQLRWRDVVGFLDVTLNGGFIEGKKLFDFFRRHFEDVAIETLPRPYAAVATRLDNGHEVWLREGSMLDAVRASIAFPGLFTPAVHNGRRLVDGVLTNPVPVSVCRALGADVVIAVALHPNLRDRRLAKKKERSTLASGQAPMSVSEGLIDKIKRTLVQSTISIMGSSREETPSVLDVVANSVEIMQLRIMRSRMAGDPPEFMITPQVPALGFLDFHRATEAMEAGRRAVDRVRSDLEAFKAGL